MISLHSMDDALLTERVIYGARVAQSTREYFDTLINSPVRIPGDDGTVIEGVLDDYYVMRTAVTQTHAHCDVVLLILQDEPVECILRVCG